MRIAIIGAGAMGSVYAGLLADAGLDVWAVDAWAEHVDAVRRDGLHISGASGERTVRLPATTDAREAAPADLVVIVTKARDVEGAAKAARDILSPSGLVLTIENGLGSAERVAAIVGPERVLIGVVGGFGASIKAPATRTTTAGSSSAWASAAAGSRRGWSASASSGNRAAASASFSFPTSTA